MSELQIIVVTAVIGLFAGVIFYVSKLFNKAGETHHEETSIAAENHKKPEEKAKQRKKSESVSSII